MDGLIQFRVKFHTKNVWAHTGERGICKFHLWKWAEFWDLHGKHCFLWISRKDCILESRGWSHSIQREIPHKECLGTHWREPQVTRAAWVSGRFLKILFFSLFFVNISKSPSPRDKRTVSLASSSNSTQENIIHQQNVSDFFYRSDWDSNQGSEKKSDAKIKPLGFIVSSPKWRMACLVRLVDGEQGVAGSNPDQVKPCW